MYQENVKGKYYLGRKVTDSYGKTLGRVVGYYTRTKGQPPLLGLELAEGDFTVVPSTQLVDEANILVVDENWKTRADALVQGLTLATRKVTALKKLYTAGEISTDAYENLQKDFDASAQQLRTDRESLMDRLGQRSNALDVRLKEVENYFVNVKVAHELGEMDDEAYRMSRDALHDLINRLQTEQKDIRAAEELLQQNPTYAEKAIKTEDKERPEEPPKAEPEENPQQTPLVVRIKEAGE